MRRVDNLVLALLGLTVVAAIAFIALYVVLPDTQLLGLAIGLAVGLLGAATIVAGKALVSQEKTTEERPDFGDAETQAEVEEIVRAGAQGISRRKLIVGASAAGASLGVAAVVPAASFGPNVGETIYATPWRPGRRLVDSRDRPIAAEEIVEDAFVTGFPEGASKAELGASIVVLRVPLDELRLAADRAAGAPEGIVAYSKICTHAACAVSMHQVPLYEPTGPPNALVCPCHFSTFDPARGAEVIFGPAGRPLPQLPLAIGLDRTLEAAGDYYDPIGPSYGGIRLRDE